MWLSVKSSLPVQCQPLHEEGRLCRPERAGLRGESPPLEAGIPAQALGATELCALGTTPPHTHTHLLTPTPTPGLRFVIPRHLCRAVRRYRHQRGRAPGPAAGRRIRGAVCPKSQPPHPCSLPHWSAGWLCKDTEQEPAFPFIWKRKIIVRKALSTVPETQQASKEHEPAFYN